jgi:hypothetical protein
MLRKERIIRMPFFSRDKRQWITRFGMRSRMFFVVVVACCALSYLPAHPAHAAATTTYSVPILNVPIPGLDFKDYPIYVEVGQITVPFLAAYILAFYKIIMGIGLVAASIMFVWGAMLYLYGATGLAVSDAKKKMTDALIGLVILLGSYVILSNINPQTVALGNLKIPTVIGDDFVFLMSNTPKDSTMLAGEDASNPTTPDPEVEPLNPVTSSQCMSIMAIEKKKLNEFILSKISGGDYAARINQVAKLLQDCHINLGSCNMVANRAMALAGVGSTDCLLKPQKGAFCWSSREMLKGLFTYLKYDAEGGGGVVAVNDRNWALGRYCKGSQTCLDKGKTAFFRSSAECETGRGAAITAVRNHFAADTRYPRNFTDRLSPGDWIITYSANTECDGFHSSVFLGWASPGKAKVFSGDIKHKPKIRIDCLDPRGCQGNYIPIVEVKHPDPAKIRPR